MKILEWTGPIIVLAVIYAGVIGCIFIMLHSDIAIWYYISKVIELIFDELKAGV